MATKKDKHNNTPTVIVQVACLIALVALSVIDASYLDFQVSNVVYAIIAGVLFGVGSIKQIFGGK